MKTTRTLFSAGLLLSCLACAGTQGRPGGYDPECPWTRAIPRSNDGTYFVGVSRPMPSESAARDRAMDDARGQATRYLADWLAVDSRVSEKLSGSLGGGLTGVREDLQLTSSNYSGVAPRLKDERWCDPGRERGMYVSRVLAFLPHAERTVAARGVLESLRSGLQAKGQLTPERAKAIDAAKAGLE